MKEWESRGSRKGEEQTMRTRTAGAMAVCAFMTLVIAIPPATGEIHTIIKDGKGPMNSAVSWLYEPVENGRWFGHIVNSGLKWLIVDVDDVTVGAPISVLHQRIRFAAYPSNVLDTQSAAMQTGHVYEIKATPNGPNGASCTLEDEFINSTLVAEFTLAAIGPTVHVDGSCSSPQDGTIVSWDWDWGDGTNGSGITASHTYAAKGYYTIVLCVIDAYGMTDLATRPVAITHSDQPPRAAFTAEADNLTVTVNASASTDDYGIAIYTWSWGDGSPNGDGAVASHTYPELSYYTLALTVTDCIGQTHTVAFSNILGVG